MSHRFDQTPTASSPVEEQADWLELQALTTARLLSRESHVAVLQRSGRQSEDELRLLVNDVYDELDRRGRALEQHGTAGYPFRLTDGGSVLSKGTNARVDSLYCFLLAISAKPVETGNW